MLKLALAFFWFGIKAKFAVYVQQKIKIFYLLFSAVFIPELNSTVGIINAYC